jgi:hypothetical protein
MVYMFKRDTQRGPKSARILAGVHAQQSLSGNPEGQTHHLVRYINDSAGGCTAVPAGQHILSHTRHQLAERSNPLTVKGWLRESALTSPELTLTGQQPLTDDQGHRLIEKLSFRVVVLVRLKNSLDTGWMRDQIPVKSRERTHSDDIAMLALHL